ncbi:MAG: hypothetical protein ACFCU5_17340 [Pleurocapsa sp.]
MNSNNLIQVVRQGFRIAIGATADCVETFQNPQKRAEAFSEIETELKQKTQAWSIKGESTEQQAKEFVENLMNQRGWSTNQSPTTASSSTSTTANKSSNINSGIQELTAEIIALKLELEKLRNSQDS